MPQSEPVNWQPISQMPLVASMIDDALDDTQAHLNTLNQARTCPHVLDDATIDRSQQVHIEQLTFVGIYAKQIDRWRTATPSAEQTQELDRMDDQNRRLRTVTEAVLTVAAELRKGTIDRIVEMSDIELGLQALLRVGSATPR